MSWWPSSGGRYVSILPQEHYPPSLTRLLQSPFAGYTSRGPPQVTADDVTYLVGDEDRHRHNSTHGRNASHDFPTSTPSRRAEPSDLDPDILVLKHKGVIYPLQFPAFSIAESLRVGDVRRAAAKETRCDDPRRVKLLYKGRSLRDDSKGCRDEGLKQNSELMCVVSADVPARGDRDGASDSESSASSAAIANGVDMTTTTRSKRKGHRGGGKKRRTDTKETRFDDSPRDQTSTFLVPPNGSAGHGSNIDRNPPSRTHSPIPPPPAPREQKKPTTPAETVDAIRSQFQTDFLPKVHALLEHPPSEAKVRIYECKKLGEVILTQVLFKLDGVETDDAAVKTKRKDCVKEANFWIGELDDLAKK